MAGLTTHILDTTRGRPASGVEIELHAVGPDGIRALVARARTNVDGRTAAALGVVALRAVALLTSRAKGVYQV